ncbi:NACHT domain-containing protein [Neolewinella agarilytica]|uniref:NACHT domain-containing protein n=1 Tax=Neolewinella agarilytica TaxID=478744 RepID=A0A1H9PAH5_9BACT|nr:NACHT domain-containing protein [Neolewinella agarilytica]SER45121.1 NACHT domain-containing protein [Neolewinella agarilytica]
MMFIYEKTIEAAIDSFVKPIFEELNNKANSIVKIQYNKLTNGFKDYLIKEYKALSELSTIVNVAKDKTLQDIYLPLKVQSGYNDKYVLADNKFFTSHSSRVKKNKIIMDSAGMGKSTILKMAFINAIEDESIIPIFIELRKLSKDHSLIDEITRKFSPIYKTEDKEFICKCLEKSKFLFLFDGYDEISFSNREVVSNQISDFNTHYNSNFCILTSRPEPGLESFSSFQQYTIKPLTKQESYAILKKYDSSGLTSNKLIEKLEELKNKNIEEFLQNPLLTSLLFTAFDYKNVVPLKKHLFYRQVYDSLFETHDLSKSGAYIRQKKTLLGVDDMHQVLRCFGYISYVSDSTIYSRDEIINLISRVNKFLPMLDFKPSDLLHDITRSVPLIGRDGMYYKWMHKSLQEYFAAQFIYLDADKKRESVLKNISLDTKNYHSNVLDIYSSIDSKNFNRYLVKPFIENVIDSLKLDVDEKLDALSDDMKIRLMLCSTGVYRFYYNIKNANIPSRRKVIFGITGPSESIHKEAKFHLAKYENVIQSRFPDLFVTTDNYSEYRDNYKDTDVKASDKLMFTVSHDEYVEGAELLEGNIRVLRFIQEFRDHSESLSYCSMININNLRTTLSMINDDIDAIDLFNFEV